MKLNRRKFLKNTSLLGLGIGPLASLKVYGRPIPATYQSGDSPSDATLGIPLNWIDRQQEAPYLGTTFGVPWPEGKVKKRQQFELRDSHGHTVPIQTWPLAFWPDGSVKWSACAVADPSGLAQDKLFLTTSEHTPPGILVQERDQSITVDNGFLKVTFGKTGNELLQEIWQNGRLVARAGILQIWMQDAPDGEPGNKLNRTVWQSYIDKTAVENSGSQRVLIRVEGIHRQGELKKIPFIIRFYLYHKSPTIKIIHTFLYDGDEQHDFIKGIGLSVVMPLQDTPTYNRYVRFVGEGGEVFSEAVKGLTGLRRDPGKEVRDRQLQGQEVKWEEIAEAVKKGMPYIPEFGDYTLLQAHPSASRIEKRTRSGHAWLHSHDGGRAMGTLYLGTPSYGIALGIRNFWQSYPGQLDIRDAASDEATLTAWLWAPMAEAMDLRFYHDGMGQDNYEKQWEGLEITYEDYEAGYGSPVGVARTSELYLSCFEQTPSPEKLGRLAQAYQQPPLLSASPSYLYEHKVFGGNWGLPDRSSPLKSALEDKLDALVAFYQGEVDRRGWYGFWNYGDVMHSYDTDRHVWKYDVGGFAWDNSELGTDLWLWYYYLRSGNRDCFRFAEAMCRHTGEVDVHHLGRFAPLGSRHNVMHWGCSAKQLRISTALNRRFYYYLTADERTGDLLREQVEAAYRLQDVVALRKRVNEPVVAPKGKALVGFGTDWGAIAAAWFTEWERTLDPRLLARLKASMHSIADQPQGFFTGLSLLDIASGKFDRQKDKTVHVSHLNAVFGLVEICQEILQVIPDKRFETAWLQYCRLYNASDEERLHELGTKEGKFNLRSSHARLTAYAAFKLGDRLLAERAWRELLGESTGSIEKATAIPLVKHGHNQQEWRNISTNEAAQWSLSTFQCLHYVGNFLKR
ncbi:hypothetical protein [Sphingobacterium thalpophilum]|uniref:exo-rhamnogalacturonan lyase family protein n=1 Tax=Sphingobacterium thalpophilum TaxID=259 RepID=UPI003C737920